MMFNKQFSRIYNSGFLLAFIFFVSCTISLAQADEPYPSLIEVNPPDGPPSDVTKAIVGVRLIDGLGGAVVNDAVVVIEGNRILAVGPRNKVAIPEGAEGYRCAGNEPASWLD
jgi:hypothetical protein